MVRRSQLLWHTVRYLRPAQVAHRVRLRAKAAWWRRLPARAQRHYERTAERFQLRPSSTRWTSGREHIARRASTLDLATAATRADDGLGGRFRFLNADRTLGRPIDWRAVDQSQLWRFKLQYSGYLVDLAATRPDSWPAAAALIREWIQANHIGRTPDAWHPFVVSERLVNWIIAIYLSGPAADLDPDIACSLATQCAFVAANLETDVGGNHLLKNLKAMAIAGCFWTGRQADRWYDTYADAFGRELTRQLLADGAHYERSPMYHALVLQDALELGAVIRGSGRAIPGSLEAGARAMLDYLPHITCPDGEIALFNDSVLGEAPSPSALHAFAASVLDDRDGTREMTTRQAALCSDLSGPGATSSARVVGHQTEDGGLVAVPALKGRGFALIDVGRACPDDLPAHAHAGLFSFELSLDSRRLIVDSGVGEYQAGAWREYYRSTRAHNTVAVDGEDQIECWGSFRVARRARIFDRQTTEAALARGVTARHDGYTRLSNPVFVRRTFVALADCAWLVVDRLEGAGNHRWDSFVHCAPDVRAELVDGRCARLSQAGRSVTIAWFGVKTASVVKGAQGPLQGWYAPEFGCHLPAPVLVLSGDGAVPAECGYLIVPDLDPDDVSIDPTPDGLRILLGRSGFLACVAAGHISVTRLN